MFDWTWKQCEICKFDVLSNEISHGECIVRWEDTEDGAESFIEDLFESWNSIIT